MRNKSKGFSLIELLIVVAIILIIAAIAIPNLLRARISANESSAVGALRTINTTAVQYASTYGVGFPASLVVMGPGAPATCNAADLLDGILGGATQPAPKSGYTFAYTGAVAAVAPAGVPCAGTGFNTFTVQAIPQTIGTTGQRSFCIDHTGVVRQDSTGAAIPVVNNQCTTAAQIVQ
jgi:prepilin-type N-terminal cleavage/methylation domain-containing protein